MPAQRFVLLEHHWNGVHYDFMIEAGDVLRTWKLSQPPEPHRRQLALATFDHRLVYLDYEGTISGDRGHVRRWDAGTYEELSCEEEILRLRLGGTRLDGVVQLRLLNESEWEWLYDET
jgi:hypothetical protein